MKTFFLSITLFTLTFSSLAQEKKGQTITVTINNILNNKGKILLSLHTVDTFMKGPGIRSTSSTIEDGKVKVGFNDVPSGIYAIIALHDENENNRMDFESNGMPLESYGASNNNLSYGPPQFTDAKFEVTDKDLEFNIRF